MIKKKSVNEESVQSRSEKLFFFSYGLFLSFYLLSFTFYFQYIAGAVYKIIMACALFLLALRELGRKQITRQEMLELFCCVVFAALVFHANTPQRNVLLGTIALLYCARDVEFEKTAAFSAKILTVLLWVIVFSSMVGIIPNHAFYTGNKVRWFLGFLFALDAPTILCNIALLTVYVKKHRMHWSGILVLFLAAAALYVQTKSRLPFGISVFILAAAVLWKAKPGWERLQNGLNYVLAAAFPLSGTLSVLASIFFRPDRPVFAFLNHLTERRVEMGHNAIFENGFSLFGKNIVMIGNGLDLKGRNTSVVFLTYSYIDNIYVQLILRYGTVFFTLLLAAISFYVIHLARHNQTVLLTVFALLALQGILQDSLLNICFNTFLAVLGNLTWSIHRGIPGNVQSGGLYHVKRKNTNPQDREIPQSSAYYSDSPASSVPDSAAGE